MVFVITFLVQRHHYVEMGILACLQEFQTSALLLVLYFRGSEKNMKGFFEFNPTSSYRHVCGFCTA